MRLSLAPFIIVRNPELSVARGGAMNPDSYRECRWYQQNK